MLQKRNSSLLTERENKISTEEMIDDPKKAIIRMVVFVSLTYIAIKVNGFLDTIWIADLGSKAVTAVSTITPVYSTVAALGVGLGTGACVCIAYNLGAENRARANRMAGTAVYLSLVVAIPVVLFLLFGVNYLYEGLKGTEVRDAITAYVLPLALGAPILILVSVMGNFLKAEGAMRAVSVSTLMSLPVNAVLTPIMVFVFDWGLAGASTATVVGSVVSLAIIIWIYSRYDTQVKPHMSVPTIAEIKEILGVGLPRTVEEFSGGFVFMVQSTLIISLAGTETLAIHGLAFAIPYLLTIVSDSISAATQPVASAALGAGKDDVMRRSMKFSGVVIVLLGALATVLLLLFPEQILKIYSGGDLSDIQEELVVATRIYGLFIPMYLLHRFSSNMMQVLRKAHVWTAVYLVLTSMQVVTIYLFATDYYSVATIVAVFTSLVGATAVTMLYYYAHRFSSQKIIEMETAGKGVIRRLR